MATGCAAARDVRQCGGAMPCSSVVSPASARSNFSRPATLSDVETLPTASGSCRCRSARAASAGSAGLGSRLGADVCATTSAPTRIAGDRWPVGALTGSGAGRKAPNGAGRLCQTLAGLVTCRPYGQKGSFFHGPPLDEVAIRARIGTRKALVEEGNYFALLGTSMLAAAGPDCVRGCTVITPILPIRARRGVGGSLPFLATQMVARIVPRSAEAVSRLAKGAVQKTNDARRTHIVLSEELCCIVRRCACERSPIVEVVGSCTTQV